MDRAGQGKAGPGNVAAHLAGGTEVIWHCAASHTATTPTPPPPPLSLHSLQHTTLQQRTVIHYSAQQCTTLQHIATYYESPNALSYTINYITILHYNTPP